MPLGDGLENICSASSSQEAKEMVMVDSPKLSGNESILNMTSDSSSPSISSAVATLNSPLPPPTETVLSAVFVSDINIPDGTLIVPKKTFIKVSNTFYQKRVLIKKCLTSFFCLQISSDVENCQQWHC